MSRKCLPHSLFGDVAFQFLTRRRLFNSGLNVFIRFCSGNVYTIIDPEVISSVSGPGMHFPFMIWECLGTMDAYREYNRKVPRAFLDGKTIRPGNDLFHFDPMVIRGLFIPFDPIMHRSILSWGVDLSSTPYLMCIEEVPPPYTGRQRKSVRGSRPSSRNLLRDLAGRKLSRRSPPASFIEDGPSLPTEAKTSWEGVSQ